jgi:hypothetical protein
MRKGPNEEGRKAGKCLRTHSWFPGFLIVRLRFGRRGFPLNDCHFPFFEGTPMALIPCPECGRQISTLASSCPGCGCPVGAVATATAAPSAPVPPPTPTKALRVVVCRGKKWDIVAAIKAVLDLTEITFDGRPVNFTEKDIYGRHYFGPIPYVPGNHVVRITAVCREYGGNRKTSRIDHNLRLTLGELRQRDSADLDIKIATLGDLDGVGLTPSDAGSIRRE